MFVLNESLNFLINRTGLAIASAFSQELKECNLSLPMWRALAVLWSSGDQTLGGLAELTSAEISTLSRQVATLAERGLVQRVQSDTNWRAINISLTPAGHSLVEKLLPTVERHEQAAANGIEADDVHRLKQLLNKVYNNLISLDEVLPLGVNAELAGQAQAE